MVNNNHFTFRLSLVAALVAGLLLLLVLVCPAQAQKEKEADVVAIQAASPVTPTVGQPLTFTISVKNNAAAQRVWLEDFLPAGVSLVSVTPSQGTCDTRHDGGSGRDSVSCAFGEVGSGRAARVEIVVTPMVAGALTNKAVAAGEFSPTTPANSSSATVTVKPPV